MRLQGCKTSKDDCINIKPAMLIVKRENVEALIVAVNSELKTSTGINAEELIKIKKLLNA